MKTGYKLRNGFLFLLLLVSGNMLASHYMGGEIRWECLPNGNYRFIMKVYRECGSTVTFGNPETLNTNAPCGPITMHLYPDAALGKRDISMNCNLNPLYPRVTCSTTVGTSNAGGVEEWYYTSDQSYPNGVNIMGTPPATGWYFSWTGCCRNPCTNIVNSMSLDWYLRAVMYPVPGSVANPCNNDSPIFAEKPQVVVTTGHPISYNPTAYDLDGDSIVYEWAQPLTAVNAPITTYATNYSYTSPLPGTLHNPNNVPAALNPSSGQLTFLSYTQGAFVTAYKVTEFRNGVRISEIFREMQVVILQTGANDSPTLSQPFPNNPDPFVDSVYFGQTVSIPISVLDTNLLNNGLDPQNVSLDIDGVMMGLNDTSMVQGCPVPPCAYLNIATPITGVSFCSALFTWETALNHLIFGGLQNPAVDYYFIMKAYDDFCPIPSYSMAPIKIVVMDFVLSAPVLDSFQINSVNGQVTLFWTPVGNDTTNSFENYYIYFKTASKSGWQLIDSVADINQSSYTHTGVNGLTQTFWYAIQTRSGHSFTFSSPNSNLVTNSTTSIPENPKEQLSIRYDTQSGNLVLSGDGTEDVRITILNPLGQKVYEKQLHGGGPVQQLVRPGKSGLYVYKIANSSGEITGKILVH